RDGDRAVDDERDDGKMVAEPAQDGTEPPQAGIAAPAAVAGVVVHADERPARRAHHGAGFLAEHQPPSLSDLVLDTLVFESSMKVLVTGGSGYVGAAIVRAFDAAGHDPVVFARHATAARLPGRAIDGDVRDTRAVTDAASGVDVICHTAALVAVWRRDPSMFDAVNVGGLQSVLAAARAHQLRRLVYTSSFLPLPPAVILHALTAHH